MKDTLNSKYILMSEWMDDVCNINCLQALSVDGIKENVQALIIDFIHVSFVLVLLCSRHTYINKMLFNIRL